MPKKGRGRTRGRGRKAARMPRSRARTGQLSWWQRLRLMLEPPHLWVVTLGALLLSAWAYGSYTALREALPFLQRFSRATWAFLVFLLSGGLLRWMDVQLTRDVLLPFALPIQPTQKPSLWFTYRLYQRDWLGAAYFVSNGQQIETYSPKQTGWGVVVCDSASAILVNTLFGPQVYGPGVHFLPPGQRAAHTIDLRAHGLLLQASRKKGALRGPTVATTREGVKIGAVLYVVCALEDFRDLPQPRHAHFTLSDEDRAMLQTAAEALWERLYIPPKQKEEEEQETLDDLREQARTFSPFFGHPRSILRAYRSLGEGERPAGRPLPWWRLAEGIVIEAWRHAVARYTLSQLLPPDIPRKGRQPRSGLERVQGELQQRLMYPLYQTPKGKWEWSPEYHKLQERGVRVLHVQLLQVLLEDYAEQHLIFAQRNPFDQMLQHLQQALLRARRERERRARYRMSLAWLRALERHLQHPVLLQVLEEFHTWGRPQAVDLAGGDLDLQILYGVLKAMNEVLETLAQETSLEECSAFRDLYIAVRNWLSSRGLLDEIP